MKKRYTITIDGGTTNTRAVLWDNDRVAGASKEEVGVRDTAVDGNSDRLKRATKRCVESLLEKERIGYQDLETIIASGMISSNVGLVEVPHLTAPVGIDNLAGALHSQVLEEVCPIPIWFIPGIKNDAEPIDLNHYEAMDVMRGEETESIFLIERYHVGRPMILILPGSHTKIVAVDEGGRITGCMTSLSGELLAALTNHTILADAVEKHFVEDHYDKKLAVAGFRNAQSVGLNRACFSARILNQFLTKNPWKIANYLLGATIQGDIMAAKKTSALFIPREAEIMVAGKDPIRTALVDLLREDGWFTNIRTHSVEQEAPMSAIGARLIAARRIALQNEAEKRITG